MSEPNDQPTKSSQRRRSSLPENLQKLLDREERYWDNYGDFENSWTTKRPNNDPPLGTADMAREQAQKGGLWKAKSEDKGSGQ
ncbi:hypothetical protein BDV29DRAFT_171907 [Aspergillus leporis]|uniref:Uncharacterized protein n=1 Tax=Aspergillus leporis TaxID=41062 RepID=A0A5N5X649_9EURO|nr:hypothetical protein BDV29DRAFT_171907 [Aspergillus leporis]